MSAYRGWIRPVIWFVRIRPPLLISFIILSMIGIVTHVFLAPQIWYGNRKGHLLPNGHGYIPKPQSENLFDTEASDPKTQSETTCTPKNHIVFLKTHKTGSSTIMNILYRYGDGRNLTFALPAHKRIHLGYPQPFTADFVEGVRSHSVDEFHIMCNHMRFRKSEVAKVMPEGTFYFSILRHPVTMMESLFTYYKSVQAFRGAGSLDSFLDKCLTNQQIPVCKTKYAHNVLTFDFGFENSWAFDAEDVEEKSYMTAAAIEKDFDLILINDYFDESLILLKHNLCWSLEDVVSFRINSRSDKTRHPVSPETAEKIIKWNFLDWRIYLHFNTTFWGKVKRLVGEENMKKEVKALRELRAKMADTCLADDGAVNPSQLTDHRLRPYQSGKAVIQGFNLKPLTDDKTKHKCFRLVTPSLQYTKFLQNKQFPSNEAR